MGTFLFWLFLLVPPAFLTFTQDPYLVKETLARTLALSAFLLWMVRLAERKAQARPFNLSIPLSLWILAALVSSLRATFPAWGLENLFWQCLLAGLCILSSQVRAEDHKKIFSAIAAASLIAGLYGAVQKSGLDLVGWAQVWGSRPSSTFGNPNFAAGWWVMTAPLFGARFLTEKRPVRWFYLGLAGLMVLNLFWGQTRGAWIALIGAVSLAVLLHDVFRPERSKKIQAASVLFIVLAVSIGGLALLKQSFRSSDPSVVERLFKWKTAERIVRAHPFFGVGPGHLKVHYALFQADLKDSPLFKDKFDFRATSESNVHNEFLQTASETGLIGLLAFLGIFAAWSWNFFGAAQKLEGEKRTERVGVLASVLAFLIYSMTNFPLAIVPNACLLFYLLGIRSDVEPHRDFKPEPRRMLAVRLFALGIFLLAAFGIILPPIQADMLRYEAGSLAASKRFAEAVPLYEESIRLDLYRSEKSAYQLGECYRAARDIPNALRAYGIALQLRNYGEIYNNIGNCYYLTGDREAAIRYWETALRLGLPNAEAQSATRNNLKSVQSMEEKRK